MSHEVSVMDNRRVDVVEVVNSQCRYTRYENYDRFDHDKYGVVCVMGFYFFRQAAKFDKQAVDFT